MEAPLSSKEKSSASEPFWRTLIWFWALPVLATPWTPAHWLELSPVLETLNDWETSPLSASWSNSCVITGAATLSKSSSFLSSWSFHQSLLSHQWLLLSSWSFHQSLSHQWLLSLSSQRLSLFQRSS